MTDASWVPGLIGAMLAIAAAVVAYALFVVSRLPGATEASSASAQGSPVAPVGAPSPELRASDLAPSSPDLAARGDDGEGPPLEAAFLGLVSHELRTPLTAMQLLLDRLSDSAAELPPRQRKLVARLEATAVRLTDLVDAILYHARIRDGRVVTSVEPFDLAALARAIADEQRPLAERKGLVLDASGAAETVSVENDPKLLRLVIVNLVSNAVKFTERGKVAISVESLGDDRVLRVTDSGSGIDAAEQKRIFEPFQNVEATKHKHLPGIGLGLSLARQIVDSLGGEITVRSEPGQGSTFTVSLPAVPRRRPARAPTS